MREGYWPHKGAASAAEAVTCIPHVNVDFPPAGSVAEREKGCQRAELDRQGTRHYNSPE